MRFFASVVVVIVVLFLVASQLPEEVKVGYLPQLTEHLDEPVLKSRFGDSRSLNYSETRKLYHLILAEVGENISVSSAREGEKASSCSVMRAKARKYTRSRNDSPLGLALDLLLQLRDGYVHGLRYLPLALRKDIRVSIESRALSLRYCGAVLKQAYNCVAPYLSSGQCPSYNFLREIRGKSDAAILESCTRSNEAYNIVV